jgi:8-oxo-dGTP pyrophosphatase MutT (NUDIX family)
LIRANLLYIIKENKILLIYKKKGHGKFLFNGIGGKIKENENIRESVVREAKEEVNIKVKNVFLCGKINFDDETGLWEVYVFRASDFEGIPCETDECKPIWFDINNIPYDKMWPDDKYWLPILIKNKKFRAFFKIRDMKIFEYYLTFNL